MNNKKPLVSIITPSYNQGQFIEETIRSVILQDYSAIEYIVIDGGSTDNSVEIINKYKHRLAWFVSEKDNGQSDAINKGIRRASGEYIAWLNSDDLFTENAVSRAVAALQAYPECGFVFSNVLSIDAQSDIFNTMIYDNWGLRDLMQFKIIGQPSIFMRQKALQEADYLDEASIYLMDHHLWLKIAAKYSIKYIDDFWSAARFHSGAKNVAHASEYGKEVFELVDWMDAHPDYHRIVEEDRRKILVGAHELTAHYLLDGGKNWAALTHYFQGAVRDPNILLRNFNRVGYSFVNGVIPINGLKKSFLQKRTKKIEEQNYTSFLEYLKEKDDKDV